MRATTILTGVTLVTCMLSLGCSEDDDSDGTTSSGETGGAGADVTGGAGAESSGGEGGGSGAGSARPAPEVRLIDDCDDGDTETLLGGSWLSFDDADAGGDAVIEPLTDPFPDGPGFHMTAPGFGGAGYAAMVAGELTGIGSHASLTVTLGASALCPTPMPFDVSEWDGIRFRAKGSIDGDVELRVLLPYSADSLRLWTEWTEVQVPFIAAGSHGAEGAGAVFNLGQAVACQRGPPAPHWAARGCGPRAGVREGCALAVRGGDG